MRFTLFGDFDQMTVKSLKSLLDTFPDDHVINVQEDILIGFGNEQRTEQYMTIDPPIKKRC